MPRKSRGGWPRRRERVFARDGYRCVACGSSENLTVDHILARALGGSDAMWNLRTLCGPCNTAKAVDEGRLSMERARPATIACSIERCPWCGDHPIEKVIPRLSIGVIPASHRRRWRGISRCDLLSGSA